LYFFAALYWFCSISRRASASNCLNRPSEVVFIGCSGTGSGLNQTEPQTEQISKFLLSNMNQNQFLNNL
jgi:hypothetical protein